MGEIPAPGNNGAIYDPLGEALLFQRLRWTLFRNTYRHLFGNSLVRPVTILLCSIVVWAFVFAFSYLGFRFVSRPPMNLPADGQIVGLLLALLFFALGVLLIFSGGLILYASLFTAAETGFLLSKPVTADQVFAYKFQGALAFSSWAFVLLGSPVLIAYGLICHSPWYFYAVLPFFFIGYLLLPGSISAILCLLLINYLPRRRKQVLILAIAVSALLIVLFIYRSVMESRAARMGDPAERETATATVLLNRIAFTRSLLLPSAWVARGLQAAGQSDMARSGYYLALIWSNGLFLYLVAAWVSSYLYRRGFNRLTTGGDLRRKHGGAWMDRILGTLLFFIPPGTRLLIVKDFRTFRRDPQQWGQVLLFTGLLALYFTNIKRMFVRDIEQVYQNGISAINLSAIALLLCTWTGRFIYPLLSLEGRKFWILGLLPLERKQLLWGKFAFSLMSGLLLAGSLMLLADIMLEVPWHAVVLHLVTVVVLAAGLSGLSVGLGACMPNFRESDPSKIAVGFGGTLNLVVCLGFLLVILGFMAAPWHLFMAAASEGPPSPLMLPVVVFTAAVGMIFGAMAVLVPLRAGVKALQKMEF
jgi:ABC-2 type transport system permease protein